MIIKVPADDGFYYIRCFDFGRDSNGLFVTAFYIRGGIINCYSASGDPSDRLAQAKSYLAKHGIDLNTCFLGEEPVSGFSTEDDIEWTPMTS